MLADCGQYPVGADEPLCQSPDLRSVLEEDERRNAPHVVVVDAVEVVARFTSATVASVTFATVPRTGSTAWHSVHPFV